MWAKECCPGPLLVPQNRDVAGLGPFRVTQLWPWSMCPIHALNLELSQPPVGKLCGVPAASGSSPIGPRQSVGPPHSLVHAAWRAQSSGRVAVAAVGLHAITLATQAGIHEVACGHGGSAAGAGGQHAGG